MKYVVVKLFSCSILLWFNTARAQVITCNIITNIGNQRICSPTALSLEQKITVAMLFSVNPLHAKFFRGNENIYLHFMSFIHIDLTQVLKMFPQVRE